MEFSRSSGILLHITSLPGEYGIGDLGPESFRFVDQLQHAGQSIWQILPLGPTIRCDSPYSSYSAFAGNALLISPQGMADEGLLSDADLAKFPTERFSSTEVNYLDVAESKWSALHVAFKNFTNGDASGLFDSFEDFCGNHSWWLDDFTFFAALTKHFGTDNWCAWDAELIKREPLAMGRWKDRLAREIQLEQFVQFIFYRQWDHLKAYANDRGVKLFGDMPIFVSHGSADVWANQDLFSLNELGKPTVVAGVPPDYFSKTGQLWGNPLYRWDRLAETNYAWWTDRFRAAFELYDMLRIDHFRAFESYWEVPATAKTAIGGKWMPGPGVAPFHAAARELGELPIVAEDLGLITDAVHELRDELGYPGMRILQFGFDAEHDTFHRPESFPENSAAYTGTHDNNTIVSWFQEREARVRAGEDILSRYLELESEGPPHWQMISMVWNSIARTAIVPMQDLLGLDDSARMNMPGKAEGNWRWRLTEGQFSEAVQVRLREMTESSNRASHAAVVSHH